MVVLAFTLMVGMIVSLFFFLASMRTLNRISRELNTMLVAADIPFKTKWRGVKRIKEQHAALNSDKSLELYLEAEKAIPVFVRRFRIFLILLILVGIVAVVLKGKGI